MKFRALTALLADARKRIVTLLFVLALPFAQLQRCPASRLYDEAARRQAPGLPPPIEGFGNVSSGLGHEYSLRWALSALSQCPLSPRQRTAWHKPFLWQLLRLLSTKAGFPSRRTAFTLVLNLW